MQYCNEKCNCVDCVNILARDAERKQAMMNIKERNPDAFKSKVVVPDVVEGVESAVSGSGSNSTVTVTINQAIKEEYVMDTIVNDVTAVNIPNSNMVTAITNEENVNRPPPSHLSGCHCKKSACLKKYCECYSIQVQCCEKCRCVDCKNISPEMLKRRMQTMESNTSSVNDSGGLMNSGGRLTSPAAVGMQVDNRFNSSQGQGVNK